MWPCWVQDVPLQLSLLQAWHTFGTSYRYNPLEINCTQTSPICFLHREIKGSYEPTLQYGMLFLRLEDDEPGVICESSIQIKQILFQNSSTMNYKKKKEENMSEGGINMHCVK